MWEAISRNKRKSVILVIVMALVLAALGGSIGGAWLGEGGIIDGIIIAGIIWFFMTLLAVTAGKDILLAFAGAREVSRDDAPQLYNVVEEMKIAAGLENMPKVYIIDTHALNAFAAGSGSSIAVAITSGMLEKLSRDELQGVIAHEIGHLKNQDSRFMTLVGIMLGVIVILADVFIRMMFYGSLFGSRRSSSRDNDGNNPIKLVLMIVAIVLAILAPLLANLIYLACSRSREYLADASAALFTRNPEGLASALEKISNCSIKLEQANRATAPMYIINPLKNKSGGGSSWFSTHPPTAERIAILRNMASGAGLEAYNEAYSSLKGKNLLSEKSIKRSDEELAMRGL